MDQNLEKEIGWLLQEKYDGKLTAAAKKDIKRIEAGEPLDYVIGFTDFLGCKILAGPDALIPRPETELMAERAIGELSSYQVHKVYKVLDMFAGSGCIGVAVLKNTENAKVVFAESEKAAIKQIQKNCTLNKIQKNRYEIIQSDIFSNIKGKFDYIFANPPYIPTTQKSGLQKSVLDYEPHAALFGGKDGLEFIRRFLAEAKNRLNPGGKIYMEFDTPQKPAIERLLKKIGYINWQFHKDQYHKWRWVVARK